MSVCPIKQLYIWKELASVLGRTRSVLVISSVIGMIQRSSKSKAILACPVQGSGGLRDGLLNTNTHKTDIRSWLFCFTGFCLR